MRSQIDPAILFHKTSHHICFPYSHFYLLIKYFGFTNLYTFTSIYLPVLTSVYHICNLSSSIIAP